MRYQDWDVLLFPHGSKIPIQEFKTQCHVAKETEPPFLSNSAFANGIYPVGGGSLSLTPVLTSFVGSLKHGDKFRVSVHSWQKPVPSHPLETYMTGDDSAMFEARLYIDGLLASTHVFDQRTQWPVVIDTNTRFEQDGHSEPLRFPPFHSTILKQEHWEPNESFGRIKVVITEGLNLSYNPSMPRRVGFDRFRDVVVFSFQHAEIDVLQYSGIAWPNPGMWKPTPKGPQRLGPIGTRPVPMLDYEAHAHSPRRPNNPYNPATSIPCYNDPAECMAKNCVHPAHYGSLFHQPAPPLYQSKWAPATSGPSNIPRNVIGVNDDPFMAPPPPPVPVHGKRWSTSQDVSMADYISSKSDHSRAYTEMSGVSYLPKDFEKTMNEAAVEEIVKALSPNKKNELMVALSPEKDTGAISPSDLPQLKYPQPQGLNFPASSYGLTNERNISIDGNPSMDISRSTSASSRPDPPMSKFPPPPRYSHSPAGSIQSKKEMAIILSADREKALDSSVGKKNEAALTSNAQISVRDPLTESAETNRQRSTSNASKRKRSFSAKPDVVVGKVSPSGVKAKGLTLLDSVYSPLKVVDASPNAGGVRLEP